MTESTPPEAVAAYNFSVDADELLPHLLWRELVKRRAGHRCEECGCSSDEHRLDAHHIDSNGKPRGGNHRLNNGRCLCVPCHAKDPARCAKISKSLSGENNPNWKHGRRAAA